MSTMSNVQLYYDVDLVDPLLDQESLDEYNRISEQLGLSCRNTLNPEKSPIPYNVLDSFSFNCLQVLCPNKHDYRKYPNSIPLTILKAIEQAESEEYFDHIYIFDNTQDPDPLVIGQRYKDDEARQKKYSWKCDRYLIGRWGAENKTLEELCDMAVNSLKQMLIKDSKLLTQKAIALNETINELPTEMIKSFLFSNTTDVENVGQNIFRKELGI